MATYDRKDHFHQRAKREGFRSRAAYKLLEIQKRHRVLARGQRIVDLGCWPGGWLQVAAQAVGPRGLVVGVDLAVIEPTLKNENVIAYCGDLSDPAILPKLLGDLGGPADVLLCDAAPKLTGVRSTDRAREESLLESIEALIPHLLKVDGDLLVKILEGPEAAAVDRRIRQVFERAKTVKAESSRKGSSERYLLARGFRPETNPQH
jgi:23S rRNA (uridine2552-2'-O)-methyltransferase